MPKAESACHLAGHVEIRPGGMCYVAGMVTGEKDGISVHSECLLHVFARIQRRLVQHSLGEQRCIQHMPGRILTDEVGPFLVHAFEGSHGVAGDSSRVGNSGMFAKMVQDQRL